MVSHGGWLADEMGLGKTICTLGLVKANPAPPPTAANAAQWGTLSAGHHALSGRIRSQATLVVCNVSLVSQWYDEAVSKLSGMGKQSVYRYYGGARVRDASQLANYDIVVTTYNVLASDWRGGRKKKAGQKGDGAELETDANWKPGPLQQVHWWRIVLDESHNIKELKTQASKACADLESGRRW